MVTPSRMDFMISASSFDVTQLRASAATLSLPFWYSMIKVNLASELYPLMSGNIYIRYSHDVGEQIVVGSDNEQLPE